MAECEMIVGLDFDNTVVSYEGVFEKAAWSKGLVTRGRSWTKYQIREYLRAQGREEKWTELQGYVYGACMRDARLFPGVKEFLACCRRSAVTVCVISHRTRYPLLGERYDLHESARHWLHEIGLFDVSTGLSPGRIFFEVTKEEKLDRVRAEACTHFVDDLPEFLTMSGFPPEVERILFDPNGEQAPPKGLKKADSWRAIRNLLFRKEDAS